MFASRRAYDFICLAIAEPRLDVKIVCALPGLTTGYGPSHQATDDLAIFRAMPNLVIVDPCDAIDVEQATGAIAAHKGPVYMRLPRGNVPVVLDRDGYRFELGRARLLRDGPDALVISAGFMTMRALAAAGRLAGEGIGVAMLHSPTIAAFRQIALPDAFLDAGALPTLHDRYGLSTSAVTEAIRSALAG